MLSKYRRVKLSKPTKHGTAGFSRTPLPSHIEKLLQELNGEEMRLGRAVKIIKHEAKKRGKVIITYNPNEICLVVYGYPIPQGYHLMNFEYI